MWKYSEILVKILDYCEMKCAMCGQLSQEDRRKVLPLSALEELFKNNPLKIERVYIWGGEPLLHPQIVEIIRFFKAQNALVAMNTNAYALSRNLTEIIESGLDRIIFSIDGSNAETHDQIRGMPGSYQRIMDAISALNGYSCNDFSIPKIRINFVVLPTNYTQIIEFLAWARQTSIYRIHFQLPIFFTRDQLNAYRNIIEDKCGCSARNYNAFVSDFQGIDYDLLGEIMKTVHEHNFGFAQFYPYPSLNSDELRRYFTTMDPIRSCRCDVFDQKLAIDSSGRFVTCPDFPDLSFGNIENGFVDTKLRRWLEGRFDSGENLPVCNRCCHFVPVE
jgi:MoaA/NifB/PqqE/SkfB family radical SAM enzyme